MSSSRPPPRDVAAKDASPSASKEDRRFLKSLSGAVNGGLARFYGGLGERVVAHPRRTVLAVLLLTLLLGLGWLRLEVEERNQKLYTPQDSEAMEAKEWVDARFPASVRFVRALYIADAGEDFLASRAGVRDLFVLWSDVENEVGGDDGLAQLCVRAANGQCAKQSVLGFWGYDRAAFEADADWVGTLSQTEAADAFSVSERVVPANVLGTYERDAGGRLTSVRALRMEWIIEQTLVLDGRSESDPVAEAFEEQFHDYVHDFRESFPGRLYSDTAWAFDLAISGAFAFDALLTAVAYVLLTIYACVVMSARNRVRSRATLALVAVFTVGCAVVSGFGFCLAIGIPFSLVVNSVVFVMLGLGVDDAFVILECLGQIDDPTLPIQAKLGRTLARAGASITLTSITDFAAFLSGSSTIIPALNAFCIFASVTILFDFMYQVTFFMAFLKWDEDRIAANQADCCCCCAPCSATNCSADPEKMACSDEKFTPEKARDTFIRRLITRWMPDVILHPAGKVAVLATAAAFIAAGVVGITKLELDFQYEWFVPEPSEANDVLDITDEYFQRGGAPVSFYTDDVDYFALQSRVSDLCDDVEANSDVDPTSVSCWYQGFEDDTGNAGSTAASAAEFYTALDDYVSTTVAGERFAAYLLWNADRSKVVAARIPAQLVGASSTEEDLDAMDSVRNTAEEYDDLGAIAFSEPFVFYEGLVVVYEETVRNLLIALAVVFGVSLIFLADISAAVLVLLMIGLIDVCLLGFIHWFGMNMNTVIAINLLLAIGLTVDYSAHIAHAYMHSAGTRQERARKALEHIGVSVFNGGFTTFVATLPLVFALSYVFQVFFRCFILIVLFGLFFGLMVLPVVLSLVGPSASYAEEESSGGSYGAVSKTSRDRVAVVEPAEEMAEAKSS